MQKLEEQPVNPSFSGVWIPTWIWYDKNLTALQLVILMHLDNFSSDWCDDTDEELAEFTGATVEDVAQAMDQLIHVGYLKGGNLSDGTRVVKSNINYVAGKNAVQGGEE